MSEPTKPSEADKNRAEVETLLGRDVPVKYADPAREPETVTVRKVALRQMGRYAACVSQDEAAEIALYTGKPLEWAESLSDESIDALLEAGRDLNLKRYANFATRATKFDNQMRQASPVLAQLADRAQAALLASRSGAVSNS